MRRRKMRWVVAGLALVTVGVCVLWVTRPSRVTQENCDRIHEAMSRAEVYTILGPPGDYRTGPVDYQVVGFRGDDADQAGKPIEGPDYALWMSDRALVVVCFSEGGSVKDGKSLYQFAGERMEQGLLDNLLWRAKHQWRRWFPEKPAS